MGRHLRPEEHRNDHERRAGSRHLPDLRSGELYPNLTRGREWNGAYVVTQAPADDERGNDALHSDRVAVLSEVLDRDTAQHAAVQVMRDEIEASGSEGGLSPGRSGGSPQKLSSNYDRHRSSAAVRGTVMPTRPPTANATGFDDHFEAARTNIFRLETLQSYGNSGEDPALAAFTAGQPHLVTPAKREWTALVRARTAAGCRMQRVHVVTEPITEYLRFELTWGYQPNVEAGEDIGIVAVAAGEWWPRELPERTDFWLFDLNVLYALHYDEGGGWLATEQVTEPAAIEQACRWRTAALQLAVPWRSYIASHPRLTESLPEGRLRAS